MNRQRLAILGTGFLSAGGKSFRETDIAFGAFSAPFHEDENGLFFPLPDYLIPDVENSLSFLRDHTRIDRTVKLAAAATRLCLQNTSETFSDQKILVNIGSSRGATETWESEFIRFREEGTPSPKASPYSTPGNISSNVAKLLGQNSVAVDHSVTCGSGLQAIANSAAWLRAGMVDLAIAGGAEAPLTPFTRAQMAAMKITPNHKQFFPTQPLAIENSHPGMLLGEGAAVFLLGKGELFPDASFFIEGIGLANESSSSPSGITNEGQALRNAMKNAMDDAQISYPDIIITHAPGTIKGDYAEISAIRSLFGDNMPALFSNKHIFGHTLGASGTLSVTTACQILASRKLPTLPYPAHGQKTLFNAPQTVLVNATGFGGNAISVLISKK